MDFPSPAQLAERARACPMVDVAQADREEFGRALILQGYSPARATRMACDLPANDGALQMLARHRIAAEARP